MRNQRNAHRYADRPDHRNGAGDRQARRSAVHAHGRVGRQLAKHFLPDIDRYRNHPQFRSSHAAGKCRHGSVRDD